MPTVTNNNLRMIDQPVWEQLVAPPVIPAAGCCIVDDDARFIYALFSAANFWRYDTWAGSWQQLASPPAGTFGAGSCMQYTSAIGGQWPASSSGVVMGSVYLLLTSGTGAPTWQKYDIATNSWTALSVTNLPATFGTDGSIAFPEPALNNYTGSYHSGVLKTITATAASSIGATSITVSSLPTALPAGAVLNFGTKISPKYAVLTSAAIATATSITVAPLITALSGTETALWYDHMYLIGNAATQMYRYSISGNAWATTSANSGNPALPALTAAAGVASTLKWLPGANGYIDKLIFFRAGGTSAVYLYDLVTNTFSTLIYHPVTETFTTGSGYGALSDSSNKPYRIWIAKDITNRIYELDIVSARINPVANQWLLNQSTAIVGDKCSILKSPEGIQFFYMILNSSAQMVRTPIFFDAKQVG